VSSIEVLEVGGNDNRLATKELKDELINLSAKVDRLALLARYDQNQTGDERLKTDIVKLTKTALKRMAGEIKDKGIQVSAEYDHKLETIVDKVGLELVLDNLLSNAIKYNRKNGRLIVGVEKGDDRIKIVIQDEGGGISINTQQKIFDRFYRGPGTSAIAPGLGIGLSLARQVCEKNRWQLIYQNKNGGTEVTLVL
jgi:signal transduction histidine kinase